ncbi:uncharacterized protein LOC131247210 isoform X2 [Magnolia sinica]|uniref:uncharacterized protein LOC131247210 isoform X2 n=1 Tax=Magnolia sinica TaxID=86752 RepID=UPI00265937BC|nr:uncharacterized protein LOC131247210 isoform X2 [Magnolia sinica]
MSAPQPNRGEGGDENGKEAAVAKTAGFVVFSGIAMSIIKALTPNFNQNKTPKPFESTAPFQEPKAVACEKPSSPRTIEIVRGDTLWGLSRKYGVSIDAIKEANGLSGDTIYAGKKLVIP